MRLISFLAPAILALAALPATAHEGHGAPAGYHHGEPAILLVAVLAVALILRRIWR